MIGEKLGYFGGVFMIFFWSVTDIFLIGLSCAYSNKKMSCSGKLNMILNQCDVKKNWVSECCKKLFTVVEIPNLLPRNFFCIFKNIVLSGWDLSRELCFCFFHIRIFYAKLEFRPRPYQTRKNDIFPFEELRFSEVNHSLSILHIRNLPSLLFRCAFAYP